MHNLHPFINLRANKTFDWIPSDTEDNYKSITKFGPNLYKPGDFTYKYNSMGFRCDEFDLSADIYVVFIGCSSTEGIGLPLEDVWAYKLLTKIRNTTGKNIPYWNLAAPGCGVDTMAHHLYQFAKEHPINYIFAYFPDLGRRDYQRAGKLEHWGASFSSDPKADYLLLDDDFQKHQAERSLMIIDSVRKANNAIMNSTTWVQNYNPIIDNFKDIGFFRSFHKMTDVARDNIHHGPKYHSTLSEMFWHRCGHYFK